MDICRQITGFERPDGGAYLIHTNCADIKVCFVTEEIVRVRVAFDREFAEESYVLAATAWEDRLDHLFAGERRRLVPAAPRVEDGGGCLRFTGARLRLELDKDPLCLRLYDGQGDLLYSSVP